MDFLFLSLQKAETLTRFLEEDTTHLVSSEVLHFLTQFSFFDIHVLKLVSVQSLFLFFQLNKSLVLTELQKGTHQTCLQYLKSLESPASSLCCICQDAPRSIAFVPCGHFFLLRRVCLSLRGVCHLSSKTRVETQSVSIENALFMSSFLSKKALDQKIIVHESRRECSVGHGRAS